MIQRTKGMLAGLAVLALAAVVIAEAHARPGLAQGPMQPPPPGKTAGEVFKNVQVLKDIPADQLMPSMQFIAGSLGVECDYCHVRGAFDKDDKETKRTARKMIQMMFAIDKDNFDGRREVTCYSCHRGSTQPVGTPVIAEEEPMPPGGEHQSATSSGPNADQLLEKYAQAVGGAEAFEKITTRVEKGKINAFGGQFPIEVYAKAPDKRLSVMHTPRGESVTAFNGQSGWLSGMGPLHYMTAAEVQAARLDADFYFPIHVKSLFAHFQAAPPEKVSAQEADVLLGLNPGQPPVKLYFDPKSGLLVRLERYAETPLGNLPTQIDYADYREADGVKIPYRWTLARPGGRFTIQVDEVQQNVAIDDAKFAEPPPPAAAEPKPPSP
jgi:photosynthetic reaction center cytochrome c subunit